MKIDDKYKWLARDKSDTYFTTSNGVLIRGDCLDKLQLIPDNSIDLIPIDIPYNIGKDTWDKIDNYVEWMGLVFKECERVLKDNGSFYFFHNDFLQMVELQNWLNNNSKFVFRQMIIWDKFNGSKSGTQGRNATYKNQKNWAKCSEYCLFYTFIDGALVENRNPFKNELTNARKKLGLSIAQVAEKGHFYGKINHGGAVTNWEKGYSIPTKEQWKLIQTFLPINKRYDELRQEYEKNKYTFNAEKDMPSVWQFDVLSQSEKIGKHPTQKPLEIYKKIIKTSSNASDVVLDCFSGSGTLAIACEELNRKWICIEKEEKYCEIARYRLLKCQEVKS